MRKLLGRKIPFLLFTVQPMRFLVLDSIILVTFLNIQVFTSFLEVWYSFLYFDSTDSTDVHVSRVGTRSYSGSVKTACRRMP